jgi:hypothetical protein
MAETKKFVQVVTIKRITETDMGRRAVLFELMDIMRSMQVPDDFEISDESVYELRRDEHGQERRWYDD